MDYMSRITVSNGGGGGTKSDFIETIIKTWKDKYRLLSTDATQTTQTKIIININNSVVHAESQDRHPPPLQQMAEEFVHWIFEKINGTTLQPCDVCRDITSCVRFIDSAGNVRDEETEGPETVYGLMRLKNDLNFQLCPNMTASGIQGRMNPFGLVMVASCGIVTRLGHFVGLYEAAFGLISESTNIWKLKHSKILIRSLNEKIEPELEQCLTLRDILEIPSENNVLQ